MPLVTWERTEGWSMFLKLKSLIAEAEFGESCPSANTSSLSSSFYFFFDRWLDLNFEIGIELQTDCSSMLSNLGEPSSPGSFLLTAYLSKGFY